MKRWDKIDSAILKDDEEKEFLMSLLGEEKELKLLWRATKDGGAMSEFHSRCDDKGPTLTIFKANTGRRMGGYTSESWDSNSDWKEDPNTFLISFDFK